MVMVMEEMKIVKNVCIFIPLLVKQPCCNLSLCLRTHAYHVAFQLVKKVSSLGVTMLLFIHMYELFCSNSYSDDEFIREH